MSRQSVAIEQDQLEELRSQFKSMDVDGDESIDFEELGNALDICGLKIPAFKVRQIVAELMSTGDTNKDGKLSLEEFTALFIKLKKDNDLGPAFRKAVSTRTDIQTHGGSSEGITHTIKDSERIAFADWINRNLSDDDDCKGMLPLDPDSDDLYTKVKDGILLCKLINKSVTDTIDERTINKSKLDVYRRTENHNLALNSAQSIGCNVVNIGHDDLEVGRPHLVLGLLWQIIRIGLLSEVNLSAHPGLVLLLEEGETIDDLLKLSPEEILLRWVNYHLRNAGINRQIKNFGSDIKDSEAYIHLLNQIAPRDAGVNLMPMNEPEGEMRAEGMLMEADKIGCRAFITSKDVVKGNSKLNMAFVANLFNNYPALEKPDDMEIELIDETREEKTYRNWMNSMGVSPQVNRLYSDMHSGLIIFQLYDIIKPGCVDWHKVNKTFSKLKVNFQKIENCNYAVELGKASKFSLVGIGGKDIHDGNPTLTLGLVWQLMRAYTLAVLTNMSPDGTPIIDKHIVEWANTKLAEGGRKCSFGSFQDSKLADGVIILNLIECLAPKKINWDVVKDGGDDERRKTKPYSERLSNAKYALSMGRKIGAKLYALPEDVVEVKPKMIMTIFACFMALDYKRSINSES